MTYLVQCDGKTHDTFKTRRQANQRVKDLHQWGRELSGEHEYNPVDWRVVRVEQAEQLLAKGQL